MLPQALPRSRQNLDFFRVVSKVISDLQEKRCSRSLTFLWLRGVGPQADYWLHPISDLLQGRRHEA